MLAQVVEHDALGLPGRVAAHGGAAHLLGSLVEEHVWEFLDAELVRLLLDRPGEVFEVGERLVLGARVLVVDQDVPLAREVELRQILGARGPSAEKHQGRQQEESDTAHVRALYPRRSAGNSCREPTGDCYY